MKNKWFLFLIVAVLVLFGVMMMSKSGKSPELTVIEDNSDKTSTEKAEPTLAEKKSYSLAEVETHDSETDCWMAIEGKVYDVTDFVAKHPGGKEILNGCGKDATVLFNERPTDDKGPHPESAKTQLEKLYIGDLN